MSRFTFVAVVSAVAGALVVAAPAPSEPTVQELIAKWSDPDEKVRNEASAALKGRANALPWLRRASRSYAPITAARAAKLLEPHEAKRQEAAAKAIDACIRDGHIDLFVEWHHYWRPGKKEDLWPVGPRAAKAGLDVYAKRLPPGKPNSLEGHIAEVAAFGRHSFYDFVGDEQLKRPESGIWHVRAERLDEPDAALVFASVAGPLRGGWRRSGGRLFTLGPVETGGLVGSFLACDGDVGDIDYWQSTTRGTLVGGCVVVCRGTVRIRSAENAVILVAGDVEFDPRGRAEDSLIRATGEIHMPKDRKPVNCTVEAHAEDATAPYKFFELTDVGLSLADDEEGLVVTAVKPDTPFGNCGLAKGDLVRAIDDSPAGHSEEFRKKVRRALVRQGDCLLTVTRGDRALDLPVFFPLPK